MRKAHWGTLKLGLFAVADECGFVNVITILSGHFKPTGTVNVKV